MAALSEAYMPTLSLRMKEIIKLLSIISAVWALMLAVCLDMIGYIMRRKWL